jgi:hypothetical protein
MATTGTDPFLQDALEANRAGELTNRQRDRLRPIARSARQSMLIAAVVFAVAAAMMLFDRDFSLPEVFRVALAGASVVLAVFFLLRAAVGADALTRDLRHRRVQSTDGAIGKRSSSPSGRGSRRLYWLDVGDGSYRVSYAGYQAAPDAGMVRVYFLPRSRRVVNLERLPDAPLAPGLTPQEVLLSLGTAMLTGRRRDVNEIRAQMAPVVDAVRPARDATVTPPPPSARDSRPLAQAIVGTWTNPFMTVAFERNGTVTATLFGGMERHGQWSVDGAGRLIAEVTGQGEAADAWVVGDELTIAADGGALRFSRR